MNKKLGPREDEWQSEVIDLVIKGLKAEPCDPKAYMSFYSKPSLPTYESYESPI